MKLFRFRKGGVKNVNEPEKLADTPRENRDTSTINYIRSECTISHSFALDERPRHTTVWYDPSARHQRNKMKATPKQDTK